MKQTLFDNKQSWAHNNGCFLEKKKTITKFLVYVPKHELFPKAKPVVTKNRKMGRQYIL
jgi:hypothetical protein